ncbi:patatin-like phospholipase family protein [Leptospira ryugenii]|nr:patatin-like phospholipase family protein [Leptospira ryugenii]
MSKTSFANKLTLIELFRNIPRTALREFVHCMQREQLQAGDILFEEGSDGNDLFILLAGKLRYDKKAISGESLKMGEFTRQDLIGELSLFTGEKRSATVRAIRDSELIRIPELRAREIFSKYPEALLSLTQVIAKRLAHANDSNIQKVQKPRVFTLLSALDQDKISSLMHRWGLSLLREGSFCFVDESFYLNRFGGLSHLEKTERESEMIRLLARLESEYDTIIYLIKDSDQNQEWIERAIRQGDVFLFVKPAEAGKHCIRLENLYFSNQKIMRPSYLVLLQPNSDKVLPGTQKHLEDSKYERFFHVHLDRPDSLDRLTRGILGKSIGLALGGGGAKGFAHLGVWKSIEENKLPIDMVAGTSAGSIFAALFAMGLRMKEASEATKKIWVDKDLLNEYTIPVLSLTTGGKYTDAIRQFFGDIQIEDLWIPFQAIACDLSTGEKVILREGSLWKAVRASTSIPGIIPPFLEGEAILVDGGVLDNVPGLPILEAGAGVLIAVDVFGDFDPKQDKEIRDYLKSPVQGVLSNPILPIFNYIQKNLSFSPQFPPIGEIIIRSFLSSSRERIHLTENAAQVYLKIPTQSFGILDWSAFSDLIDLGYTESIVPISEFARDRQSVSKSF